MRFIIARDTEKKPNRIEMRLLLQANVEAVNAFGDATREAGAAAPERSVIGQHPPLSDLVQYNDGFKNQSDQFFTTANCGTDCGFEECWR